MLSLLLYLYAIVICTLFLIVSALVLVVTWPFDKSRRAVHELSRVLVHLFFGVPPSGASGWRGWSMSTGAAPTSSC